MSSGVTTGEGGLRVVLATPTLTKPHPACVASVEAAIPALDAAGISHQVVYEIGNPYISNARAVMLRKALDAKADVVVFIDHDIEFKPSDLVKLIQTQGDVVAGTYRFKTDEEEYMGAVLSAPDGTPSLRDDGCVDAVRVPAGFLKVTKEAVDRIARAHPELTYGPAYAPSLDLFNHGAFEGIYWGEDYAFSRRWRAMGEGLWVVPDLDLIHHGEKAYPGNFHQFLMRQPGGVNDPARAQSSEPA